MDGNHRARRQAGQHPRSFLAIGLGNPQSGRYGLGRRAIEGGADQPHHVVGRVRLGVVVEREIEQRAASTAREAGQVAGTAHGEQKIARYVRLEIEGQIVAMTPPAARPCQQLDRPVALVTSSQPPSVERLDAIDEGDLRRARSAFQLPTTRSIVASAARLRSSANAGSAMTRSPIRSSRRQRMRPGAACRRGASA